MVHCLASFELNATYVGHIVGARRVSEGLHTPSRPGERRQTPGWAAEEKSRELAGNKGSVCREEKTAANQQASADE